MKFQLTPVVLTVLTTVATAKDLRGSGSGGGGDGEHPIQEYLQEKIQDSKTELRDRIDKFRDHHPHPLAEGIEKIVSQAQTVHQHVRDSIAEFHDEMVKGRHELAERLATFEEGQDGQFSLQCAMQSRSEEGCVADDTCNWCTSDKLLMALKLSGFCASKEAKTKLTGWGLECGEKTTEEWTFIPEDETLETVPETQLLMEEVESSSSSNEELDTLFDASGAGDLTDLLFVSEVAFEQPEDEAEIALLMEEEVESSSSSEELDTLDAVAEAGDLTDLLFVSEAAFEQPQDEAELALFMEEEEGGMFDFDNHCLYQESVNDCGQGSDEEGNPCVWCKYNSWLGRCVVAEDTDLIAGEFAMTCADKNMV